MSDRQFVFDASCATDVAVMQRGFDVKVDPNSSAAQPLVEITHQNFFDRVTIFLGQIGFVDSNNLTYPYQINWAISGGIVDTDDDMFLATGVTNLASVADVVDNPRKGYLFRLRGIPMDTMFIYAGVTLKGASPESAIITLRIICDMAGGDPGINVGSGIG